MGEDRKAVSFLSPHRPCCPSYVLSAAKEGGGQSIRIALAGADSKTALEGAAEIVAEGLATPLLVGEAEGIRGTARKHKISLNSMPILDTPAEKIGGRVAELARCGEAEIVMKGSLKTETFMRALVAREGGLRIKGQRMVHVFYMTPIEARAPDASAETVRGLFLSDCAVNTLPDEATQRESLRHMALLAHSLGIVRPRLGVLSASETPLSALPSSFQAEALARWAQSALPNVDVAGPLPLDVAISREAAEIKQIANPVAGRADGLLVPDIVAGNALFKMLVWCKGACAAGIVMGGLVPIVLTSRADPAEARLASVALAVIATRDQA